MEDWNLDGREKNRMELCGLDSSGSGKREVECFCDKGNKISVSINSLKILENVFAFQERLGSVRLVTDELTQSRIYIGIAWTENGTCREGLCEHVS
jgi:hypothetical protein